MFAACICAILLSPLSLSWPMNFAFVHIDDWDRASGCHVRYFVADCEVFPGKPGSSTPSGIQRLLLEFITLERSGSAVLPSGEKYSEKFFFHFDNESEEPVQFLLYDIASEKGMVVYGRSQKNGCTARVYTPAPEDLYLDSGVTALEYRQNLPENLKKIANGLHGGKDGADTGSNEGHPGYIFSEKICFFLPASRTPADEYPYFVMSESGYAIAGRTGKDGCAPELVVPIAESFKVYGGKDAVEMNVKGPGDW